MRKNVNNDSMYFEEDTHMQNELWEQVRQFLNRLRCENMSRNTAIEVPGYMETQREMENLRNKCEEIIDQLPLEEKQILLAWMEKLEEMNSLEGQKAYCQGYVDCILLLSGMGLLRQDLSIKELMKWL